MEIRKDTSSALIVAKPVETRPHGFSASPAATVDTGKVRLCGLASPLAEERPLSKAFIDEAIRTVKSLTGAAIGDAAEVVAAALVAELQATGKFVLAGVGTFTLRETEAVPGPHAGANVQKTVQFEACSSVLCQV